MKQVSHKIVSVCVGVLLLSACTDPNEDANAAIIKIGQSFNTVVKQDDLNKRLLDLNDLKGQMAALINAYPTTNVAVKLQNDDKVGGVSMSMLDRQISITDILTDRHKLAIAMTLEGVLSRELAVRDKEKRLTWDRVLTYIQCAPVDKIEFNKGEISKFVAAADEVIKFGYSRYWIGEERVALQYLSDEERQKSGEINFGHQYPNMHGYAQFDNDIMWANGLSRCYEPKWGQPEAL